uniref:MYND-type domain-containing protein n=1 Tax=Haemonchus contortus TaxID=6289 RepID=A0A7I4YPR2_HAECO
MPSSEKLFEEEPICFALAVKHLNAYCHSCLKMGSDLKKCKGCRMFYYCSADCQKKDWPLHKTECSMCKRLDGVSNEEVRLVMRLAIKWASGDMGATQVDDDVRSLSTLQHHAEAFEIKSRQFLEEYKVFCKKAIVGDEVVKRLARVACVNSFSLTNNYSTTIGIALCIKLSVIDHSCKPNVRYAYRGTTAVMVPTDMSHKPKSLKEARHSYINDLLPRSVRREILMRDYNFDCECEGCLDEERNERMEAWHCDECGDGWLKRDDKDAECSRCGWSISMDHFELCRVAEETARSGNEFLAKSQIKLQDRVELAEKVFSVTDGALYRFNVLRIPSLRVLFENAVAQKNIEKMLKYGNDLLSLQGQYQNEDDLALCHLKYGLAQAYKLAGDQENCRQLLTGVREVFGRAYGTNSSIYALISLMC